MEGDNPLITAIMLCTMILLPIWPLFAAGLVVAAALAWFSQWIAAILIAIPSLWITGCAAWSRFAQPD